MDSTAQSPNGRLTGWKEIATYFGRAVRTVQRWERELGLPIHRLATGKGETVFALVEELDAWLAANERAASAGLDSEAAPSAATAADRAPDSGTIPPATHDSPPPTVIAPPVVPSPAPGWAKRGVLAVAGRRRTALWALAGGLLLLVMAAVIVAWAVGIGSGDQRIPSAYRRAGRQLTVLDQSGEVMWHRTMPFELNEKLYATDYRLQPPVLFQDLDGDGRTEVLFKVVGSRPSDSALHVFEENGQPRFTWTYGGTKRFGGTPYPAPWVVRDAIVRHRPGAVEIWVVIAHAPWFPSALVRLDARGRMTGEFWHAGNLSTVVPARVDGRDVLLAGGANNEFKSAFLAVVDPDTSSTAPALRDYYTCHDCPAAPPLRYVVFPRTATSRELDVQAFTRQTVQDSAGRLFVAVEHLGFLPPGESETLNAQAFYTLDDRLRAESAEVPGDYVRACRKLELDGRLSRPFDQAEHERELWPIREWNGSDFVPLPAPPREP